MKILPVVEALRSARSEYMDIRAREFDAESNCAGYTFKLFPEGLRL